MKITVEFNGTLEECNDFLKRILGDPAKGRKVAIVDCGITFEDVSTAELHGSYPAGREGE